MPLQILIIILAFPYVGKLTVIYIIKATQYKMQNEIVFREYSANICMMPYCWMPKWQCVNLVLVTKCSKTGLHQVLGDGTL